MLCISFMQYIYVHMQGMPPSIPQWPSCGLNLTHCYSEALSFCKVPKTGAIMLLGVRQVGLQGPLLWQECHKRRKAKVENWKKKKKRKESMRPEKRSSRSTPLNTSAVLPHKELGHKGFWRKLFTTPCRKWGLQLRWTPQPVLDGKSRQLVSWFCMALSGVRCIESIWSVEVKENRRLYAFLK